MDIFSVYLLSYVVNISHTIKAKRKKTLNYLCILIFNFTSHVKPSELVRPPPRVSLRSTKTKREYNRSRIPVDFLFVWDFVLRRLIYLMIFSLLAVKLRLKIILDINLRKNHSRLLTYLLTSSGFMSCI